MFNPFLRGLKSDFVGTRYSAFWSHVTSEGVTLVSSVECGVSDVTPEQAKQVSPVMTHLICNSVAVDRITQYLTVELIEVLACALL